MTDYDYVITIPEPGAGRTDLLVSRGDLVPTFTKSEGTLDNITAYATQDPEITAITKNVLHDFSSFNYLFTLSCLEKSALQTPESYNELVDKFIVARSIGKGTGTFGSGKGIDLRYVKPLRRDTAVGQNGGFDPVTGLKNPPVIVDDYSNKTLVDDFNKNSSGALDLFFADVNIEAIISPDKRTGYSMATKVQFTVVEPYGISGFLEALQVAAVAAGHPTFQSAPFIFKVEFKGFADTDSPNYPAGIPVQVEPATRFFVLKFAEIKMTADASGTKYSCECLPFSEYVLGNAQKLQSSISSTGSSVEEILTNFFNTINEVTRQLSQVGNSAVGNNAQTDEYQLYFPSYVNKKLDLTTPNKIASSSVGNLVKDDVGNAFLSPKEVYAKKGKKTIDFTPSTEKISITFSKGDNIADCISAVVRDSKFCTDVFSNFQSKLVDGAHIEWFIVNTEIDFKDIWDSTRNQPFFIYKFYVIPYLVHASRIPQYGNFKLPSTLPAVQNRIRRTYDYLYTGNNVDILNFNIQFNALYVQGQAIKSGNQPIDGSQDAIKTGTPDKIILPLKSLDGSVIAKSDGVTFAPIITDPRSTKFNASGPMTRPVQDSPYVTLTQNLYRTLLDNDAMLEIEIEILGDPYYLVQSGHSNLKPAMNPTYPGITVTGSADSLAAQTYIKLNFANPLDIDEITGIMTWAVIPEYSGVYWVSEVVSKFNEGVFKQILKCKKIMGQIIEGQTIAANSPGENYADVYQEFNNPIA